MLTQLSLRLVDDELMGILIVYFVTVYCFVKKVYIKFVKDIKCIYFITQYKYLAVATANDRKRECVYCVMNVWCCTNFLNAPFSFNISSLYEPISTTWPLSSTAIWSETKLIQDLTKVSYIGASNVQYLHFWWSTICALLLTLFYPSLFVEVLLGLSVHFLSREHLLLRRVVRYRDSVNIGKKVLNKT